MPPRPRLPLRLPSGNRSRSWPKSNSDSAEEVIANIAIVVRSSRNHRTIDGRIRVVGKRLYLRSSERMIHQAGVLTAGTPFHIFLAAKLIFGDERSLSAAGRQIERRQAGRRRCAVVGDVSFAGMKAGNRDGRAVPPGGI